MKIPLKIYVKSICSQQTRSGVYCAVFVLDGKLFKTETIQIKNTTNNECEMLAAIYALNFVANKSKDVTKADISVFSSSEYLVKGINEWINRWVINGWIGASGKSVTNKDWWRNLDSLKKRTGANFYWVPKSSVDKYGRMADDLCHKEMSVNNLNGSRTFNVRKEKTYRRVEEPIVVKHDDKYISGCDPISNSLTVKDIVVNRKFA